VRVSCLVAERAGEVSAVQSCGGRDRGFESCRNRSTLFDRQRAGEIEPVCCLFFKHLSHERSGEINHWDRWKVHGHELNRCYTVRQTRRSRNWCASFKYSLMGSSALFSIQAVILINMICHQAKGSEAIQSPSLSSNASEKRWLQTNLSVVRIPLMYFFMWRTWSVEIT